MNNLCLVALLLSGCSFYYDLIPNDLSGVAVDGSDGSISDMGDLSVLDEAKPDLKPECETSSTCPSDKPVCDESEGKCRACVSGAADDAACAARASSAPYCGTSGTCVECLQSMQCGTDKPVCGGAGACGACVSAADDAVCLARDAAKGHCEFTAGPNLGRCVACTSSAQCASGSPVCELTATDATRNVCRACAAHAECDSGVCIFDGSNAGQCAASAQVALVDNGGSTVATCKTTRPTRDGDSPATAYCDVAEAVSESVARPFARIAGSAQPYGAIALNDRALTLVGPGSSASPTARLFTLSQPAIGVMVSGTQVVTLVVDGLDLGGDASQKTSNGLYCSRSGGTASAVVTVRNSSLHDSSAAGIDASSCTLTVDASTVSNNTGAGISASGGTLTVDASIINGNGSTGVTVGSSASYTITNNIISGNGSGGSPGVSIGDTGSTGDVAFNTVTKNGGLNSIEGGVVCPASGTNKLIQASIVVGNSASGGTQFAGKCQLQNVVTGTDSFAGATMLTPTFQSATNYHLVAGDTMNTACCIDKLAAPGTPNANHDVDSTPRPKGTGSTPYDIGAHEVQ